MTERQSRRTFLRDTGSGVLGFYLAGQILYLTPAEAREQNIPLRVLNAHQARSLDALGEVLLPGAAAAGVVHFVDHQLAAPAADQLLMIRYLGVEPPFTPFYLGGLAALDQQAQARFQKPFADLDPSQQTTLVGQIAQANPEGWDGPPAPLFYFVLRSDALDVVYGTQSGVESLDVPYMAHIVPPSRWGE